MKFSLRHSLLRDIRRMVFRVLFPMLPWVVTEGFAGTNQITILNDAFGKRNDLELDWGYSALIEFEGRRILFDAGDNTALFQRNLERMHVDLAKIDFVVMSHAHADHTAGLRYVLSRIPKVPLFVPDEVYFRGTEVPRPFFTTNPEPSLPPERRYYGGHFPEHIKSWQEWNDSNLTVVSDRMTIAPHIRIVALSSTKPPFVGVHEISLVLETPRGLVVVAGCSHPGIEQIMAAAVADSPSQNVYMLFGGLHLLQDTRTQINATLSVLFDQFHVRKMAVGHCTGELAFALIAERWGENDVYAGLGEIVSF